MDKQNVSDPQNGLLRRKYVCLLQLAKILGKPGMNVLKATRLVTFTLYESQLSGKKKSNTGSRSAKCMKTGNKMTAKDGGLQAIAEAVLV